MNQLTFLLPLKNRADYSITWLQHNINPDYDYFIADGSSDDSNENLFSNLNLPNLTYKRYPEDKTVGVFLSKVWDAMRQIDTPYLMMCDNDDFLNFYGIPGCLDALAAHPEAVCAGGPLVGVSHIRKSDSKILYSLPFKIVPSSAKLNGKAGFEALQQMFRDYSHMYYNVFRTVVCREIWQDINRLEIENVFLMELLQAELTFCHGKYIETGANHYIRLTNPTSSVAKSAGENDISHFQKIYFDEAYRTEALKISRHVAALLQVDINRFLDHFKFFYIGKRMIPKAIGIISLQFRSRIVTVLPHFQIKTIIKLVNLFNRGNRA
jgi:glycosyltransferase domain-containing protein